MQKDGLKTKKFVVSSLTLPGFNKRHRKFTEKPASNWLNPLTINGDDNEN